MSEAKVFEAGNMNLNLPLLVIDNNQPWEPKNYKKNGLYFVKAKDGSFHIVEVVLEDNNIYQSNLPQTVMNHLVEQQFALSMTENIRNMFNDFSEQIQSRIVESEEKVSETKP